MHVWLLFICCLSLFCSLIYLLYIYDCCQLQEMWQEYIECAYDSCSPTFWSFFNAVRGQTVVCQDKVMRVAKHEISIRTPKLKKSWPASNRTLRNRIDKRAGLFWDNVVEARTIDLRQFMLPTCESIKFSYIDPIFTWIQRCNELLDDNHSLIWDPVIATHPDTGEEVFGSGIQSGLLLRHATAGWLIYMFSTGIHTSIGVCAL